MDAGMHRTVPGENTNPFVHQSHHCRDERRQVPVGLAGGVNQRQHARNENRTDVAQQGVGGQKKLWESQFGSLAGKHEPENETANEG